MINAMSPIVNVVSHTDCWRLGSNPQMVILRFGEKGTQLDSQRISARLVFTREYTISRRSCFGSLRLGITEFSPCLVQFWRSLFCS